MVGGAGFSGLVKKRSLWELDENFCFTVHSVSHVSTTAPGGTGQPLDRLFVRVAVVAGACVVGTIVGGGRSCGGGHVLDVRDSPSVSVYNPRWTAGTGVGGRGQAVEFGAAYLKDLPEATHLSIALLGTVRSQTQQQQQQSAASLHPSSSFPSFIGSATETTTATNKRSGTTILQKTTGQQAAATARRQQPAQHHHHRLLRHKQQQQQQHQQQQQKQLAPNEFGCTSATTDGLAGAENNPADGPVYPSHLLVPIGWATISLFDWQHRLIQGKRTLDLQPYTKELLTALAAASSSNSNTASDAAWPTGGQQPQALSSGSPPSSAKQQQQQHSSQRQKQHTKTVGVGFSEQKQQQRHCCCCDGSAGTESRGILFAQHRLEYLVLGVGGGVGCQQQKMMASTCCPSSSSSSSSAGGTAIAQMQHHAGAARPFRQGAAAGTVGPATNECHGGGGGGGGGLLIEKSGSWRSASAVSLSSGCCVSGVVVPNPPSSTSCVMTNPSTLGAATSAMSPLLQLTPRLDIEFPDFASASCNNNNNNSSHTNNITTGYDGSITGGFANNSSSNNNDSEVGFLVVNGCLVDSFGGFGFGLLHHPEHNGTANYAPSSYGPWSSSSSSALLLLLLSSSCSSLSALPAAAAAYASVPLVVEWPDDEMVQRYITVLEERRQRRTMAACCYCCAGSGIATNATTKTTERDQQHQQCCRSGGRRLKYLRQAWSTTTSATATTIYDLEEQQQQQFGGPAVADDAGKRIVESAPDNWDSGASPEFDCLCCCANAAYDDECNRINGAASTMMGRCCSCFHGSASASSNDPNQDKLTPDSAALERLLAIRRCLDPSGQLNLDDQLFVWRIRTKIQRLFPQMLPVLADCGAVLWRSRETVCEFYRLLDGWPQLQVETAIELLDERYVDLRVRRLAVQHLESALSNDQLQLYLLVLVQTIRYEPYADSALARWLLVRALCDYRVGSTLFWLLRAELANLSPEDGGCIHSSVALNIPNTGAEPATAAANIKSVLLAQQQQHNNGAATTMNVSSASSSSSFCSSPFGHPPVAAYSQLYLRLALLMEAYLRGNSDHLPATIKQVGLVRALARLSDTVVRPAGNKDLATRRLQQELLALKRSLQNMPSPLNWTDQLGELIVSECRVLGSAKQPILLTWQNAAGQPTPPVAPAPCSPLVGPATATTVPAAPSSYPASGGNSTSAAGGATSPPTTPGAGAEPAARQQRKMSAAAGSTIAAGCPAAAPTCPLWSASSSPHSTSATTAAAATAAASEHGGGGGRAMGVSPPTTESGSAGRKPAAVVVLVPLTGGVVAGPGSSTAAGPTSGLFPSAAAAGGAPPSAGTHQLIFKSGDDLRQDMLTLQVMRIMDAKWKAQHLDYCMTLYEVLPVGRNIGLIHVVQNCQTLFQIQCAERGSSALNMDVALLNKYIYKKCSNDSKQYLECVDRFAASLAGYCVATYILGIKDRHQDNIMLARDGRIFHIDFGHFLGHTKRKLGINRERTDFVLTDHFLYLISKGKPNFRQTYEYTSFRDECTKAFMVIHYNARFFIVLFRMAVCMGLPELRSQDNIEFLRSSLMYDKVNREEARVAFEQIFEHVVKGDWSISLNWFFHSVNHSRLLPAVLIGAIQPQQQQSEQQQQRAAGQQSARSSRNATERNNDATTTTQHDQQQQQHRRPGTSGVGGRLLPALGLSATAAGGPPPATAQPSSSGTGSTKANNGRRQRRNSSAIVSMAASTLKFATNQKHQRF